MSRAPERAGGTASGDPNVLITLVASAATACLVLTASSAWNAATARPAAFLAFVGLTLALQLVSVPVYNRGAISFAGTGLLALGFSFGAGAAIGVAAVMGVVNLVVRRGRLNRGVFDIAQISLAAGAGATVYGALTSADAGLLERIGPGVLAGGVHMTVNIGLLALAMGLAEGISPLAIWKERFRWFAPYHLASGPLALALNIAYEQTGIAGLVAFALPPAFMMLSIHQYLARTRESVEEVRQANVELAARNADLYALFELTGGLAARTHDRDELIAYVEASIARLTGGVAHVALEPTAAGHELVAAGTRVGSLVVSETAAFDGERWERLRNAILPQLATSIEGALLVDQVRKTHLATIAALSRSMEAKDYYTGGHTERVSDVSVALAKRLGYAGADLDAIEIGALLHDIGKIGIPERILHKPGPLDDEEWKVMKEHPVISDYILSEVDLNPIVRQIARSSHERMDGAGYPDALAGDDIPLPARIVLVADAFDALTSDRPYRRARHTLAAIEELKANAGTQFCPLVVDALARLYREEPEVLTGFHLRAVEDVA